MILFYIMIILNNITGFSCYVISILYILQCIPEFINRLKTFTCNTNTLSYRIYKLYSNEYKDINFINVLKHIALLDERWRSYDHQDSHEFLYFLLYQIQQESHNIFNGIINTINNVDTNCCIININNIISSLNETSYYKFDYSPIIDIFNGSMQYIKKCTFCNTKHYKYEKFISIDLEINNIHDTELTLYDCLDNFFKKYQLDKDNNYYCDFCGVHTNAYCKNYICKLPEILIIQLKRFKYESNTNNFYKINTYITYPEILNLKKYITNNILINSCEYILKGINIHLSNNNINYGHYISIIKSDNEWYLCNDNNVNSISEKKSIFKNNPYLLFYSLNK